MHSIVVFIFVYFSCRWHSIRSFAVKREILIQINSICIWAVSPFRLSHAIKSIRFVFSFVIQNRAFRAQSTLSYRAPAKRGEREQEQESKSARKQCWRRRRSAKDCIWASISYIVVKIIAAGKMKMHIMNAAKCQPAATKRDAANVSERIRNSNS